MSSYKTCLIAAFIAFLGSIAGCSADGTSAANDSTFSSGGSRDVREPAPDARERLDLGEDWSEAASPRPAAGSGGGALPPQEPYWAVLLGTFSDPGHQRAARTFINSASTIDAKLSRAHVFADEKGSRVVYGRYESVDERAAQRDLAWVKSLRWKERTVFPGALLIRITPDTAPADLRPIDLMTLRARYPNVDPLYTLQVGLWGEFGSGRLSFEEIRRRAESSVRELRGRGFEAYVHHDEPKQLSIVTVGAFDRTAIDVNSGFESDELAALRKHFPVHLVNGEPMLELESRVTDKTRPQRPRLVAVPEE